MPRNDRPPNAHRPSRDVTPVTERIAENVAPAGVLAGAAIELADRVEEAVYRDGRRADRTIAAFLRQRRDLATADGRFLSRAVFALFRWRGWIEPMNLATTAERLLFSSILDDTTLSQPARLWAREAGRDPSRLVPLGDAPNWVARAEGFRRLLDGNPVTTDPWRLFPDWLREHLAVPPGGGSTKTRFVSLLQTLQTRPPLWVRAQGADQERTWTEMKRLGIRVWVHRKLLRTAKLENDVDIYHLPPFERGELEIQDLASQAVALACNPDPGERWWDACAGAGGKSLHLAALMNGKGVVVATDVHEGKLKEIVRRARRSPFRNVSTKPWDGKHVPAKAKSFDGVLVDAPCSAIGTWRRNPDGRWLLDRDAVPRLAALQSQILKTASAGVKVGGTLVYSVCTLTTSETTGVVNGFLRENPGFTLDPFPNPLSGELSDGRLLIWPQDADTDAMFIARMTRVS